MLQALKTYLQEDPEGLRAISKACALEDQAMELVTGRIHPDLVAKCEAIRAKGGPAPNPTPPPAPLLREDSKVGLDSAQRQQRGSRASGRLRGEHVDER